jgi:amidohydrolase
MKDYIAKAQSLFTYTQELRRDFHRHPELGFQEFRTAGIVAKELNNLGLEVTTGVAQTGVVALLEGKFPGPVVLVRFDMDALPIQEETGADYASVNPGVMHACGHDGHTAIGLTVARILEGQRESLHGTVKFVFQPAEEGYGGAEQMVAAGVLTNPRPDVSLGVHLWNVKPVGWYGISPGPVMAASEIFHIQVHGKGGHGALPHLAIDPVVASAQIVAALQTVVARNVPPDQAGVVTVSTIHGGDAHNVIPTKVEMSGTIRSFDPDVREMILQRFTEIVTQTASALGCRTEIKLESLTPAVINHPDVTARVLQVAQSLFPEESISSQFITMGSEDMAFMMQDIPGCYCFVGSANPEKGLGAPHHHPRFDIDEQALTRAVALVAATVESYLGDA